MKNNYVFLIFLIFILFFLYCEKDTSTFPTINLNDLSELQIKFITGSGYTNFTPPVLQDLVHIGFSLEFKNISVSDTIRGLNFDSCEVFLTTDSLWGTIEIAPLEQINILPMVTDTVNFVKVLAPIKLFDPPCKKSFYLKFIIKDKYDNFINFKTDTMYYECVP